MGGKRHIESAMSNIKQNTGTSEKFENAALLDSALGLPSTTSQKNSPLKTELSKTMTSP